jgi:hypothetical protein
MAAAVLKQRFIVLAIILGALLAIPMTELLLRVSYQYSGISNGSWNTHPDAGSVDGNPLTRAGIARFAIGSHTIDEAIYWHAQKDSGGQGLRADMRYIVHFPARPDVSEFWSLTLYDSEDRLAHHPAERYSVSNSSPIKFNLDGSFDIFVSNMQPASAGNWVSSPSQGNVSLLLRYYGASRAMLDNLESTPLPQIMLYDGEVW